MPAEAEERWYDSEIEATDRTVFVIREKVSRRPIGTCGLHEIDLRNRSAAFGIAIGEPSARGKGYGTEATTLTLDYGFSILGLHSIRLGVFEFNLAGQRAYARAGFKECGRYREHIWMYGRMWDEIHMDILATEFTSPALAKAHGPDQSR
jgi:RimJ/RimL family protein N-acetyltransferase